MRVIVFHSKYGCDTGCCGHRVELIGDDGVRQKRRFSFDHPFEEHLTEDVKKAFARQLVTDEFGEEHVKDLDWEHCIIENDL